MSHRLHVKQDRDLWWRIAINGKPLAYTWNLYRTQTGALAALRGLRRRPKGAGLEDLTDAMPLAILSAQEPGTQEDTMPKRPLTPKEAENLQKFIDAEGGEVKAGQKLGGYNPSTLSRTLNRRTGPSRPLREKLVQNGIVKA